MSIGGPRCRLALRPPGMACTHIKPAGTRRAEKGSRRQAVQDADARGRAMLSVETARDAGRRIYASVCPAWMLVRDWAARRRLSSMAPVLAVAAALLLTARFYYDEQRYLEKLGPKALAGFAVIGTISGSHLGLESLVLDRNP